MNNRRHRLVIIVGLGILSACSSAGLPEKAQVAPVEQIVIPSDLPPATSTAVLPTEMPTEVEIQPVVETPVAKTGLEASDPRSVSLVNGRPTFVEFFAFW